MKFNSKEIKILYVKFKPKETDRNRQELTGTDRNRQEKTGTDRNRQEYTGLCILRRKLLHHKEIHTSDRKSLIKEQTGIDRNRQE